MKLKDRLQHAWNAFTAKEAESWNISTGSSSYNPAHRSLRRYSNSSYVSAIFNRIALDVAATQIQHVKINATNDDRTYIESGLINCLTVEANIDQTGMQFIQDIVYSMFDEGVVAQVMHKGPYDDEPATVTILDGYARSQGYGLDFSDARRHHEIYLSDPRRAKPENLKTIIRHPVVKVG